MREARCPPQRSKSQVVIITAKQRGDKRPTRSARQKDSTHQSCRLEVPVCSGPGQPIWRCILGPVHPARFLALFPPCWLQSGTTTYRVRRPLKRLSEHNTDRESWATTDAPLLCASCCRSPPPPPPPPFVTPTCGCTETAHLSLHIHLSLRSNTSLFDTSSYTNSISRLVRARQVGTPRDDIGRKRLAALAPRRLPTFQSPSQSASRSAPCIEPSNRRGSG